MSLFKVNEKCCLQEKCKIYVAKTNRFASKFENKLTFLLSLSSAGTEKDRKSSSTSATMGDSVTHCTYI